MAESNVAGSRFLAISHKHSKLLAFAGGIIVFTTFVVKEGMESSLKAIAQSVSLATQVFAIRRDINSEQQLLLPVTITINEIQARQRAGLKNDSSDLSDETEKMSSTAKTALLSVSSSDDNTNTLLDGIQDQEANALREKLAEAQKHTENLSQTRQLLQKESQQHRNEAKDNDSLKQQFEQLVLQSQIAQKDATERGEDALRIAMEYRNRAQKHYETYSDLSYGLYGLGWGLALIGRMFGVEELADID